MTKLISYLGRDLYNRELYFYLKHWPMNTNQSDLPLFMLNSVDPSLDYLFTNQTFSILPPSSKNSTNIKFI